MESEIGAFRPGKYSTVPLYNIQAVAAATGVPSITLRSWERRYGVPIPSRDVRGYRLYSERDIVIARWLKERVRQGVGISRAVNMLQVIEASERAITLPSTLDFDTLRARLLDAIVALDEPAIANVIAEALVVASVEDVALKLLQPALYQIGSMWAEGTLSVTSEHFASHLIRDQIMQLIRVSPSAIRPEHVLVACAPGELHEIGALMLVLFLKRRGFGVTYAGANTESSSLEADILRFRPSAVCLSAGSTASASCAAQIFSRLRPRFNGLLCYGGRAFNENSALLVDTPGVFVGRDAVAAVAAIESTLSA